MGGHRRHGWDEAIARYIRSAEKSIQELRPIEKKRLEINSLLGLDPETRISYKNWITVHTDLLFEKWDFRDYKEPYHNYIKFHGREEWDDKEWRKLMKSLFIKKELRKKFIGEINAFSMTG